MDSKTTEQPQVVQITRILDTAVWVENDCLSGSRHVVVQHEGCSPFTYATFHYRYGYTDNAGTHAAATQLAIELGATEPVEVRARAPLAEDKATAALRLIANYPVPEQDDMQAANLRAIAVRALSPSPI